MTNDELRKVAEAAPSPLKGQKMTEPLTNEQARALFRCTCAEIPPTMPTARMKHLPECQLMATQAELRRIALMMKANDAEALQNYLYGSVKDGEA